MNYSLYIKQLNKDTETIWRETLGSASEYAYKRAFDDEVEIDFWKSHSKIYDTLPSLYDYAPETLDNIISVIGDNKSVLEIGAGTGKFTIPMSKRQKKIIAVDMSKDMLDKLDDKANNIHNIVTINSKIEDIKDYKVDVIYGVNSIYRMQDIKNTIKSLMNIASEKALFVWTMQRSIYDSILNKTDKKGIFRKQEYIHILNVLYDMGIDCNLDIKSVSKNITIEDIGKNYNELLGISENYDIDYDYLKKEFEKNLIDSKTYKCELKVAYISFDVRL